MKNKEVVERGKVSFQVALDAIEYILEHVDFEIRDIDNRKLIKPASLSCILQQEKMVREVNFFKPDMREDDWVVQDECREIEPIPATVHLITPAMTG